MRPAVLLLVPLAFCPGCTPPGSSDEAKADLMSIVLQYHQFVSERAAAPGDAADLMEFVDPYGNLPGNAAASSRSKTALESGEYVVLWSYDVTADFSRNGETVLAYHRDVPQRGGYVGFADGMVKLLTAEQFAAAPKADALKAEALNVEAPVAGQ